MENNFERKVYGWKELSILYAPGLTHSFCIEDSLSG